MHSILFLGFLLGFATTYILGCCTPDQWVGYQPSYGGYSKFDKMGTSKEFSTTYYDATNKRKAVFMTYLDGDKQNRFHVITRCEDDNAQDDACNIFVVDLQKNKCWTKKTSGFRKSCIPKDAKINGYGTVGFGDNSMKIVSWVMQKKSITAYVSVAMLDKDKDLCVPVSETLSGQMHKVGFMQYIGFIDFQSGIKNQTVFDIPKQCKDNLDMSVEADFERDHFVMAV